MESTSWKLATAALTWTLLAAPPTAGQTAGEIEDAPPTAAAPSGGPPPARWAAPPPAAPDGAADPADPLSAGALGRDALIAEVLAHNPGIEAARAAWRAAAQREPQAAALDDPTAGYALAPLSLGSSDVRYGDELRLGQRLPYPGTLRLRGEVARAEAAAAEQRIERLRLDLAATAAMLWDEYWLTARSLETTDRHVALLESFKRVATGRYAAGLAPQQAPIQAEVEAAHLLHRLVELGTRRRVLTARINALLHRPPAAPLPPPAGLDVRSFGTAPGGEPDEALARVLAARPELLEQQAEIAGRRATVGLRELERRPDFELSTSYNSMWDMPEHRWMVGVGLRVPFRRARIEAGVAEAEALVAAGESELESLTDEVRAEVEVARLGLEEAAHVIHLYDDRVLPASRDQLAAARAGFETGANPMLALIDAERSLLTAELGRHRAVAAYASRHAELARALGRMPTSTAGGDQPAGDPLAEKR